MAIALKHAHPNYYPNILPELMGFGLALAAYFTPVIGLAIYAIPLSIRILQKERVMGEHFANY
ncbi:isoprenylcysteine carboxylmethyltransferase family protein [Rhizobium mayense]|uniref:Isoprenylcysteine carboxylmethyltransferase family protein n=1 Tax=Rhizobium mayense TaxID=1312184 RepID=A0ABT7K4U9_9HYPH|nr:isoprenylcysteine carboxylmethyltransferase family protein [Rhizobium mayense]MDL2403644.1 isoprenylcysteine carboxylmethyltransferase family protein [Rhizobium mayense]